MGDCYIVRRGGFGGGGSAILYTFTGAHQLITQPDGTQIVYLQSSGEFVPKRGAKADIFMIGGGGMGVSVGGKAAGGGGYHETLTGFALSRNMPYTVTIGEGGTQTGQSGGATSAFGTTVNGGGAATPGGDAYAKCKVHSTSGTSGNLYYYETLTSDAVSRGQGYHEVDLMYPLEQVKHTNGAQVYAAYPSGYYRCVVDETISVEYAAGVDGIGGTQTRIFGTGDLAGGTGGSAETPLPGQGGGTVNPNGGNGLVAVRFIK